MSRLLLAQRTLTVNDAALPTLGNLHIPTGELLLRPWLHGRIRALLAKAGVQLIQQQAPGSRAPPLSLVNGHNRSCPILRCDPVWCATWLVAQCTCNCDSPERFVLEKCGDATLWRVQSPQFANGA